MNKQRLTITAACGLAITARIAGAAQSTNSTTMEKTVIEGVPLEETIVPTARPFSSVYGSDMSILDTPRNVTIISREQLDAISITDPRDFMKLTSSSFTDSNFGAPTTPSIRGQYADSFVNGSRVGLSSNGNGLPIDFNAIESVNIVKGPASVVYGPSQYVGGYVDYITKRPFYDDFHGSAYGDFGMYDQTRWGLDFGGPIGDSKTQGFRVSYAGEDSGSYYTDGFRRTEAVYTAYEWTPSENYNIFVNNEVFYARYTENFGINRPTQALIDHGLYQSGVNNNNGTGPTPGDPQNAINVFPGGGNSIALGPVVPISRRTRLLMPGDHSEGASDNAQIIQTLKLTDDAQLVNTTFLRYVRRSTESSYYYSEVMDPTWSLDNRTELRLTLDHHSLNTGLDVKYQSVRAWDDFYSEPANVWDLTQSQSGINIFKSGLPFTYPNYPVPGWDPRFRFTPDNGDSGVSSDLFVGPFIQENWKITDKLSLLAGGRVDVVEADYHVDWLDPETGHNHLGDNTLFALPNANASLNYRWTPEYSSYATYNFSENPVGATGNGGGITTGGNPSFPSALLRNQAILYEVGSKASLFGNRLFLNASVFDQERADRQVFGGTDTVRTKGFEFEANYQPSRNFYLTFSYTWMDARTTTLPFFVNNTDLPGYVNYPGVPPPNHGGYRMQGLPQNQMNLLATYKFDCGFGLQAGIVAASEINNDVLGTIRIPAQYTLDLSTFYTWNRFTARVSVLNATDEKNWSPPNYVYGQESIVADLPIRLEGRLTVRF